MKQPSLVIMFIYRGYKSNDETANQTHWKTQKTTCSCIKLKKSVSNEAGKVYSLEQTDSCSKGVYCTSRRSLLHYCDPRPLLRNNVVQRRP